VPDVNFLYITGGLLYFVKDIAYGIQVSMGIGRGVASLDFEILFLAISVLIKKCFSRNFELVK